MQNNKEKTKLEVVDTDSQIAMSQEETRKWLAKFFPISVFLLIVGVVVLSIFFHDKDYYMIFGTAITGLVAILGGIVGFYFGGKH